MNRSIHFHKKEKNASDRIHLSSIQICKYTSLLSILNTWGEMEFIKIYILFVVLKKSICVVFCVARIFLLFRHSKTNNIVRDSRGELAHDQKGSSSSGMPSIVSPTTVSSTGTTLGRIASVISIYSPPWSFHLPSML